MSKRKQIHFEISRIARYKGLMMSKYFLIISLVIATCINGYLGYSDSPFYILIVLCLFPYIFSEILGERHFSNPIRMLTRLAESYSYTPLSSIVNNIGYTVSLILIFLWLINFRTLTHLHTWFQYAPTVLMIAAILSRILFTMYYIMKIHLTFRI